MHGYFYAQYLFSSTLTLVISSLLVPSSIGNSNDTESLETAMEMLHRMTDHGNLAATEFYENLLRVRQIQTRIPEMSMGQWSAIERETQTLPTGSMTCHLQPKSQIRMNSLNFLAHVQFLVPGPPLKWHSWDPRCRTFWGDQGVIWTWLGRGKFPLEMRLGWIAGLYYGRRDYGRYLDGKN